MCMYGLMNCKNYMAPLLQPFPQNFTRLLGKFEKGSFFPFSKFRAWKARNHWFSIFEVNFGRLGWSINFSTVFSFIQERNFLFFLFWKEKGIFWFMETRKHLYKIKPYHFIPSLFLGFSTFPQFSKNFLADRNLLESWRDKNRIPIVMLKSVLIEIEGNKIVVKKLHYSIRNYWTPWYKRFTKMLQR